MTASVRRDPLGHKLLRGLALAARIDMAAGVAITAALLVWVNWH